MWQIWILIDFQPGKKWPDEIFFVAIGFDDVDRFGKAYDESDDKRDSGGVEERPGHEENTNYRHWVNEKSEEKS